MANFGAFSVLRLLMFCRSPFKQYRLPREIILCAIRWYLRFPLSYQDIVVLLAERSIEVNRSTVFRSCATTANR